MNLVFPCFALFIAAVGSVSAADRPATVPLKLEPFDYKGVRWKSCANNRKNGGHCL
jgi:hypothetical protein